LKKIVLKHVNNSFNYGTAMMAINFIEYLTVNSDEEIEFLLDIKDDINLKRIESELTVNCKLKKLKYYEKKRKNQSTIFAKIFSKIETFKKYYFDLKELFKVKTDTIVYLGGDDLSEYYTSSGIILQLLELYFLSKKKNVFLISQTIGPFSSWRKTLSKYLLNNCSIYTRDPVSTRYIKNILKLNKVIESRDLAFLDLPKQNIKYHKEVLNKYSIDGKNYITIIPSGLYSHYTEDFQNYIRCWKNIISKLIKKTNRPIVLLPHVVKPDVADDRNIIKQVVNSLDEKEIVKYINKAILPSEARAIIGGSYCIISGRMHPAISSFQNKVPAITLSYSIKYKGVIAEGLGFPELVIEANNKNKWDNEEIVEKVFDKFIYLEKNYIMIENKIKSKVEEIKKNILLHIKELSKFLSNN